MRNFGQLIVVQMPVKKKMEKSLLASVYTGDKNEIKIGNRQGYLDQFLQVHVLCMADHQAVRNFYGRK